MSEIIPPSEVRSEIRDKIHFVNTKILTGDYTVGPDDKIDPPEAFSGPMYDLNDESLNGNERALLDHWVESMLANKPTDAPVKTTLISPDGLTKVKVFEILIGNNENPWHLSEWQTEGEKPQYVFWHSEWYDLLYLDDYQDIENSP